MATRESIAAAAFEAAAFWDGREPFKVRDPRIEPVERDVLACPSTGDTITVADVTIDGGRVRITVTRMDRYTKVRRFRFTPEDWRTIARSLRVIHLAGYQAGESAPGRVLE